jgi:hypothetical protein
MQSLVSNPSLKAETVEGLSRLQRCYPLGRERRANLLVGLARIFVYYIRYINVCAGFF